MDNISQNSLGEVLKFLEPKEIVQTELVNTAIKQKLTSIGPFLCMNCLWPGIFSVISHRKDLTYSKFKSISKEVYQSKEELNFLPYQTDGDQFGSYWGLQSLAIKGGVYCTKRGRKENVLVKIILTKDYLVNPLTDRTEAKKQDLELQSFTDYFAVSSVQVLAPNSGYTCPLTQVMFFISSEEVSNLEVVQRFKGANSIQRVQEIASELGVPAYSRKNCVCFGASNLEPKPMCYILTKKDTSYNEQISGSVCSEFLEEKVDLNQAFVGKHVYMLMIKGFEGESYFENNIDIGQVIFTGCHINLDF